jgi:competence protein ComEC
MSELPSAGRRWRLPLLAASCLAANLAAHQLAVLPGGAWFVPLAILAAFALQFSKLRYLCVALAAFAWTVCVANGQLQDRLRAEDNGRDFAVTGWIDNFPNVGAHRSVFGLRVDGNSSGVPSRLRLSWYDPPFALAPGDRLSVNVRLRAPRGLMNPGGFDYERWLLLESYGATGYVRNGRQLPDARLGLAARWLKFRHGLAQRMAAAGTSADAGALLTALVLGERAGFDDSHWRVLRRTGTSHLVAISGMHVGLLAALSFWLMRMLCLRAPEPLPAYDLEIAAAVSASMALLYAALAGFALPTQRAVLMLCVALWVVVSRRRIARSDGFSAALLLVLAADPLASLTASFWLSFAAVGVLLGLTGVARRVNDLSQRRRLLGRLNVFTRLQWSMSLGLVPLVAVYFGEVSFAAPLINLIAIPVFSLLLVPLALLASLALMLDASAVQLMAVAGLCADAVWGALRFASGQAWAAAVLPAVPAWTALLATSAVVLALPWHELPGRRLAWLGLLPLALGSRANLSNGQADVLVIDVGHGLAVLVETARHRLLYDAGPLSRSGFDAGLELVVPILRRRARAGLDLMVVGHGDSDHAGGAPAVMTAFPDAALISGPDVELEPATTCMSGDAWVWDGVRFEILHPTAAFLPHGNESSCVLKVSTATQSLLLTGDIERRAEASLSAKRESRADVVVVPHHGSATSSSPDFVAAVKPELAVVSAGFANRWGFPRPEIRARWQAAGAKVVVTGEVGAVSFRLGAGPIVVHAERARRKRYWRAETSTVSGDSLYGAL